MTIEELDYRIEFLSKWMRDMDAQYHRIEEELTLLFKQKAELEDGPDSDQDFDTRYDEYAQHNE